jgi:hypothetical protein
MEYIVELPAFVSLDWFGELTMKVAGNTELANVQLSELRPPPGAMGARFVPTLKVVVSTAAELASILTLLVALSDRPTHTPPVALTPAVQSCSVRLTNATETVEMTVPCQGPASREVIDTVVQRAFDQFPGEAPRIEIATLDIKRRPGGSEHVRP